ncbi:CHAT domain-containing protein [Romeria aff. gracilis LEGE 07310]|uniref:CHAT domain-containing protein n=2 Tax=Vasconcelosia TaxID=3366328 RepID=A0A8J7AKB4_9CYAN|nr:CHAT domain-containing protein [Romeria aff. gracilis LEGE 07310]
MSRRMKRMMDATIRNPIGLLLLAWLAAGGQLPPAIAGSLASDEPPAAAGAGANLADTAAAELRVSAAISAGQELAALQQIPLSERTPEQQRRARSLMAQQQHLQDAFDQFLKQPAVQSALEQLRQSNSGTSLEPSDFGQVQAQLAQMEGAVLFYPLMLEDRLELVLVTADAPPLRRTVAVSRADLEQAVANFRESLEKQGNDPFTPAQQLYEWLIAPFEAELAQAEAKAILLSSDGALRTIPYAALHDGEQWLVERFAFNRVNPRSLADLGTDSLESLRPLIGGVSETQFEGTVGGRDVKLNDLPGVAQEVDLISELIPDATVLLNDELSEVELLERVRNHNIVHLATHTLLMPDTPQDSLLLFGNEEIVTLQDLQNWDLSGVELVILSGGRTALDVELGDEIGLTSFSYLMQRAGAEAVMASLWDFSDFTPTVLMPEFYQALITGYSPAEALQQAQIAMIREAAGPEVRQVKASLTIINADTDSESEHPSLRGFAHPYHWAAFVLTGNGM